MRALTWQGNEHVEVTDVPDPVIQEPNDIIIRVTSTAICGSDLHLYGVLGPFLKPGDVLGHEPMGIVEETGPDITHLRAGDRVVIPFNISCGHCWMCQRGLFAQCETTQVRSQGKGAALFGYTSLYGSVPGRPGRSTCGCRRPSSGRSRSPKAPLTSSTCTCRTSCPLPTRPWPMRTSLTAARWPCWPRTGRADGCADRPSPWRGARDRGGPGVRTAGGGRTVWRRRPSTRARSTTPRAR